jgi:hypothetical protein
LLGAQVCSVTGQTHSTSPEANKRLVESRRDVHRNPGRVEVFVSSGRFRGQYLGLTARVRNGMARQQRAFSARCLGHSTRKRRESSM